MFYAQKSRTRGYLYGWGDMVEKKTEAPRLSSWRFCAHFDNMWRGGILREGIIEDVR